jgi:PQQ-like domain
VVDGTVYVGCRDDHVYAIDAATGRKKWDYPTSKSWVIGTPAVRDGVVYVGTSDSSLFMALDAKTGRLRFNFDAKAYVFSSAALAGDLVYVGAHNGKLYAVDTKTGKLAWEFRTEGSKKDPSGRKHLRLCSTTSRICTSIFHALRRSAPSCRRWPWTTEWSISAAWTAICTRCSRPTREARTTMTRPDRSLLLLALSLVVSHISLAQAMPANQDREFWRTIALNHYAIRSISF